MVQKAAVCVGFFPVDDLLFYPIYSNHDHRCAPRFQSVVYITAKKKAFGSRLYLIHFCTDFGSRRSGKGLHTVLPRINSGLPKKLSYLGRSRSGQ